GQNDTAAEANRAALAIEPQHLPTLAASAPLAAAMGRDDDAVALYERARAAGPDAPGLAEGDGVVLLRMQRPDAAGEAFRKELALDGARAVSRAGLGACLRVEGRLLEALSELERARDLDPSRAATYVDLAETYERLNRGADAEEALVRAEALDAGAST